MKNCHSLIPAYKIKVYKKSTEKYETLKLQTLKHFESHPKYDHETTTTKNSKKTTFDNTVSLIPLNNEHLSSSLNNTKKTSDFPITESSIPAITVSSIKVSHNANDSISPVIAQTFLNSTPRTNLTLIPEPKRQHKNTEQIMYMQPVENSCAKTS